MKYLRGVPLIPFIFPINVFLIGDSIGAGFQFLLVRILEVSQNWSIIFLWRELQIVIDGVIKGRTALSILVWITGVILLGLAAILIVMSQRKGSRNVLIYGLGCALIMISTMIQYGPLFHGPAGVAIPIGLPLLVVIGYLLWKDATRADSAEEYDDDLDEPDALTCAEPLTVTPAADPGADD